LLKAAFAECTHEGGCAVDPVTTAIIAAVAAGAEAGAKDVATKGVVDGYQALKSLIKRKFGDSSDAVKALAELESKPESDGRKRTVMEELASVKAVNDVDLRKAAQALLDQIKAQPGGERHIQIAEGTGIAQADRGSIATVNMYGRNNG
jgi:hypothetical protein